VDTLTTFGVVTLTLMLIFYALEDNGPVFTLAFALSCVASSTYGFLQGAWPFGVVEAIWTVVALRRWRVRLRSSRALTSGPVRSRGPKGDDPEWHQSK
jgi:hypothetical protein